MFVESESGIREHMGEGHLIQVIEEDGLEMECTLCGVTLLGLEERP